MAENKQISEFLDYYIAGDNSYNYAVMITAPWGAGKTHFIKPYKKDGIAYVSIFGVKTLKQLEKRIFDSNASRRQKLSKGVIKTAAGFIKNKLAVSEDDFEIEFDFAKAEKKLASLYGVNFKTLIIDDFERSDISMTELMGFVSQQLEREKKVIIVCNESEITENLDDYKKQKEKIVGKTFQLGCEEKVAIGSFIEKAKTKEILKNFSHEIVEIFSDFEQKAGKQNLRIVHQTICDFDFFAKHFSPEQLAYFVKADHFVESFIRYGMYLKLNIESSLDRALYMHELSESAGKGKKKMQNEAIKSYIYDSDSTPGNILSYAVWTDILARSVVETDKISKQIKDYVEADKEPWRTLWGYKYQHSDAEYKNEITKLWTYFNDNSKNTLTNMMHSACILLDASNCKTTNITAAEIHKVFFSWLDSHIDELFKYNNHELFQGARGKGYVGENAPWFKEFIVKIQERRKTAAGEQEQKQSLELQNLIAQKSDQQRVGHLLFLQNNPDAKNLLNSLDIKELMKDFDNGKATFIHLHVIGSAISRYYSGSPDFEVMKKDCEWLKELSRALAKYKSPESTANEIGYSETLAKDMVKELGPKIEELESEILRGTKLKVVS